MTMSKTVAAGFQSRSAHFITAGNGAREAGVVRGADRGREGTVWGTKGADGRGRECRVWTTMLLELASLTTGLAPTKRTHHPG